MTLYMKNELHSGMRKMTNLKNSNQVPGLGTKIIDVERMRLIINRLRAGHTLLTHRFLMEGLPCLNVSCVTVMQ